MAVITEFPRRAITLYVDDPECGVEPFAPKLKAAIREFADGSEEDTEQGLTGSFTASNGVTIRWQAAVMRGAAQRQRCE